MRINAQSSSVNINLQLDEINKLTEQAKSGNKEVEEQIGTLIDKRIVQGRHEVLDMTSVPPWAIKLVKIHQQLSHAIDQMPAHHKSSIPQKAFQTLNCSEGHLKTLSEKIGPNLWAQSEKELVESIPLSLMTDSTEMLPPVNPNLVEINDKILAFIHGDSFIASTDYEVGSSLANIEFLLPYLVENERQLGSSKVLPMLNDFTGRKNRYPLTAPASKEGMHAFHYEAMTYAEELTQKTLSLKPGERFLIDGGWSTPGGGGACDVLLN